MIHAVQPASPGAIQPQGGPSRPPPPSHAEVIQDLGTDLPDAVRDEMLATVDQMLAEGGDHASIRSYVDGALSANGIEVPDRPQGALVETTA